jgi:hypothetical protein
MDHTARKAPAMNVTRDDDGTRQASEGVAASVALRTELEASSRTLFAADQADVHEAMNSVRWERRGFLQRLTRGSH